GRVPLGTVTGVIGANLPDVDAATYFLGADVALGFRRGWTHGVLAVALLPPLLAWAMHLVDRIRCAQTPTATPVPVVRLLALSYLAVLSHPALDWLNTYGIRLLMPFDGRWFYGDALFIVDPWVWLALGTIVVLAHSGSRLQAAGWTALAVIATALVTGVPGVPVVLRVLWCLGLAVVAGLRVWAGLQPRLQRVATISLVLAGLYVAAMVGSSRLVRLEVAQWARDRGLEASRIMVIPSPADPFRRNVLIADDQHYHRLTFDWLASERVQPRGGATPIGDEHPAARAALAAPAIWGLATWTRFPCFTIEALTDGYRVAVADMRFGRGVVELDRNLKPR
ncbi:MAG: metal-dependent hydrolase, partial [Vicinamibacterales bacterium]|nr:metal-dependent hydrolase [Vicinamibacterales bacterium]